MNRRSYVSVVLGLSTAFLLSPLSAQAYLDPGTGSMLLQIFMATLLGALFTIKTWWRSVSGFVRGLFGKKGN